MKIETVDDLQLVIDSQNEHIAAQGTVIAAMDELVRAMDAKIKTYVALVDIHHKIFIQQGLATPRPVEDPVAIN